MAKFGDGKWDRPALAAVIAVVAAGLVYPWWQERQEAMRKRAEADAREMQRRAALAKAPPGPLKPRVFEIQGTRSQMLELSIPQPELLGLSSVQKCYVWRDAELQAVTMSCPREPDMLMPGEVVAE